jgi:hypothetical protein
MRRRNGTAVATRECSGRDNGLIFDLPVFDLIWCDLIFVFHEKYNLVSWLVNMYVIYRPQGGKNGSTTNEALTNRQLGGKNALKVGQVGADASVFRRFLTILTFCCFFSFSCGWIVENGV